MLVVTYNTRKYEKECEKRSDMKSVKGKKKKINPAFEQNLEKQNLVERSNYLENLSGRFHLPASAVFRRPDVYIPYQVRGALHGNTAHWPLRWPFCLLP